MGRDWVDGAGAVLSSQPDPELSVERGPGTAGDEVRASWKAAFDRETCVDGPPMLLEPVQGAVDMARVLDGFGSHGVGEPDTSGWDPVFSAPDANVNMLSD